MTSYPTPLKSPWPNGTGAKGGESYLPPRLQAPYRLFFRPPSRRLTEIDSSQLRAATLTRASILPAGWGKSNQAPQFLRDIGYVGQEDELRNALHATGREFGADTPQTEFPTIEVRPMDREPEGPDPNLALSRDILSELAKDPGLKYLRDHSPHLSTFVSARVMRDLRGGLKDTHASIRNSLTCAAEQGVASIREEAGLILSPNKRPGGRPLSIPQEQCVTFLSPRLGKCSTITGVTILGAQWGVFDFGDTIPAVADGPINEFYGK